MEQGKNNKETGNKADEQDCHEVSGTDKKREGCGHGWKHMLMMAACCLTPLVLFFLVSRGIFGDVSGYSGYAGYLMLLICPLMHLFMMRNMRKDSPKCGSENGK